MFIRGMLGLGDNIYARAFVKKHLGAYLETPWPQLYADIDVKCVRPSTQPARKRRTSSVRRSGISHLVVVSSESPTARCRSSRACAKLSGASPVRLICQTSVHHRSKGAMSWFARRRFALSGVQTRATHFLSTSQALPQRCAAGAGKWFPWRTWSRVRNGRSIHFLRQTSSP